MIGCGIGRLLRMFWVLAMLLVRSIRNTPQHKEAIFVFTEVSPPLQIEEKRPSDATNSGDKME